MLSNPFSRIPWLTSCARAWALTQTKNPIMSICELTHIIAKPVNVQVNVWTRFAQASAHATECSAGVESQTNAPFATMAAEVLHM